MKLSIIILIIFIPMYTQSDSLYKKIYKPFINNKNKNIFHITLFKTM